MTPTDDDKKSLLRRYPVVAAAFAGVCVLAVLLGLLLRPTPQLGSNEDVYKTVDALFTAVTARDEKRLGECETRLNAHRAAGMLPASAADTLAGVIQKARAGSWETAAERLYGFVKAQRREGEAPAVVAKPAGKKR